MENHTNEAVKNLGLATTALIEGLESKIDYSSIGTEETALLRQIRAQIHTHLAKANAAACSHFFQFASAIKLVHYDLTALLEITKPYQYDDFSQIYQTQLGLIESCTIRAGLGKTGMNLFAGINAAIHRDMQEEREPVRVYGNGFYFEQVGFIGSEHTLEQALRDPSIKNIDLFACQFNPNIEIAADFTHYQVGQIATDIHDIFNLKPATKKLTVAIDSTIDYIDSPKMRDLINEFKEEIRSGKINFVFFRSGQKLDMYGMDNYYGAPFVTINNGSPQWDSFKALQRSESVKTDLLSAQWFCLANEFTHAYLDQYRSLIFKNTRALLDRLPRQLHNAEARVRINTIDERMDPCFIDIKVRGFMHKTRAKLILCNFYKHCLEHNISVTSRASFGFHHANIILISINEVKGSSSIRLTPGTNPEENAVIREFLENLIYYL